MLYSEQKIGKFFNYKESFNKSKASIRKMFMPETFIPWDYSYILR